MAVADRREVRPYSFESLAIPVVLFIGTIHFAFFGGFQILGEIANNFFLAGDTALDRALQHGGLRGVNYLFHGVTLEIVFAAIVVFLVYHLSIRVYMHSYLTHAAFKMPLWLRYIYVTLAAGVAQSSALLWAGMHFHHHKYEDSEGDLHSPIVGFFVGVRREMMTFWMKVLAFLHSHTGWVFLKSSYEVRTSARFRAKPVQGDLHREVVWQHKNYWWLMPLMAFGVPTLIGACLGDVFGGFTFIGAVRLVVQYHCTWIVNSLGHLIGEHIEPDSYATNFGSFGSPDTWIFWATVVFIMMPLAILTVGEIWHAYHHQSPRDWRLGQRWWQFDPGAWVISTQSKIRLFGSYLAYDLTERKNRPRSPFSPPNVPRVALH